jgi:hypothetical protein
VTSAAYYGPRRDFDPVTLACKGLLVEEPRTNFLLYSSAFDQADWLKLAGGTGVVPTVTADQGTAPDGTSTADRVQFNRGAGTTGADISRLFQDYTDPGSGVATNTVWLKSYDGVSSFTVMFQNGSGSSTLTVTGSWQRFSIASTSTSANFQLRLQGDTTPQTADLLVWGAQGEYGSFATSYIPTTGAATATRNADVASVSTQAFPYSATEGSVVINLQHMTSPSPANQAHWQIISPSNILGTDRYQNATSMAVRGLGLNVDTGKTLTTNVAKVGTSFTTTEVNLLINGGTAYTNTSASGTLSGATSLQIGNTSNAYQLNGWVRQLTYLPRKLSVSELQTRTTL